MRRVLFLTAWEPSNSARLAGNTSRSLPVILLEKNAKFFMKGRNPEHSDPDVPWGYILGAVV